MKLNSIDFKAQARLELDLKSSGSAQMEKSSSRSTSRSEKVGVIAQIANTYSRNLARTRRDLNGSKCDVIKVICLLS